MPRKPLPPIHLKQHMHHHFHAQVSASTIGEPDLGLLTPPEMATKVNQIASAVPTLTVLADADTGKSQRFGEGCTQKFNLWFQQGVVWVP